MGAVRARYDERVASGALTGDAAQAGAASRLDALAAALSAPQKRGLFSKPPEPVRGVYLWGGVGRGKSMLMDMFFAEAKMSPKRRVHFH